MSYGGGFNTQGNFGTSNAENTNNFNNTDQSNNDNKKSGFLNRLSRKNKEEESNQIQKNIDNSLKVNVNDVVNLQDMNMKTSLFFRVHVSGMIESANVKFYLF